MRDKRIMSYIGRVIWYSDGVYMVAKGDGTDIYFDSLHSAMDWIKNNRKEKDNAKTLIS